MYLVKTPLFVQYLFKRLVWRIKNTDRVFLTFDDGPVPEATPWVLDVLATHNIKATFFCVGENVKKYPSIYNRIIEEGHTVGNHTYNHLNAWNTNKDVYLDNVNKASGVIDSGLFRPPYGRIFPSISKDLAATYDIIMWDVLSGDFDGNITAEDCLQNVKSTSTAGSIIVFHDSIKAIEKLKFVLPRVIEFFKEKGIEMDKIKAINRS